MQPLYSIWTAVAVAGIYTLWQRYCEVRGRRVRTIQERVTYMLWIASQIH